MAHPSRRVLGNHRATLPPLHAAAARGDVNAVTGFLASGDDILKLDPLMGASALHFAAQSGSIEITGLLLDRGAFINLQSHSHGMTPLMIAVWHRRPAVARLLLSRADIDPSVRSRLGATAEDMVGDATPEDAELRVVFDAFRTRAEALRRSQPLIAVLEDQALSPADRDQQVATLLAAGADPNEVAPIHDRENPGHTPLLIAARDGLVATVRMLLDAGADMTLVDHFMLAHPAHKAGYMGRAEVMRALCNHPRFAEIADIQGPLNGYTALHDAVWQGHAETVRLLIEAGVALDRRGHDGQTAIDMATRFGFETIRAMLESAAQSNPARKRA
jgi:uncharacterized protein